MLEFSAGHLFFFFWFARDWGIGLLEPENRGFYSVSERDTIGKIEGEGEGKRKREVFWEL
jgi:hypothetical protein